MKPTKGKLVALGAMGIAATVLVTAGLLFKARILANYYIRRLESEVEGRPPYGPDLIRHPGDTYRAFPEPESVSALVKLGPSAVQPLIHGLKNKSEHVRRYSAKALGNIAPQDRRVVLSLIESLNDENCYVRCVSAEALGVIGRHAQPAIARLIHVLTSDDYLPARIAAAQSLGQIGPEAHEAIPFLIEKTKSRRERMPSGEQIGDSILPDVAAEAVRRILDENPGKKE